MAKPAWVERILTDTQSRTSFMEYIDSKENEALQKMRDALTDLESDKARIFAGESEAWKSLRHQIKMYEREEEQHGIIQEQQARSTR